MMVDFGLLRIQYEVLGLSLSELAAESGVALSVLKSRSRAGRWRSWWKSGALEKPKIDLVPDEITGIAPDPDELERLEAQKFVELAADRLSVYKAAKDLHLARKYFEMESRMIQSAADLLANKEVSASELRAIGNLYRDLKASVGAESKVMSRGSVKEDATVGPLVVLQDMTGNLTAAEKRAKEGDE